MATETYDRTWLHKIMEMFNDKTISPQDLAERAYPLIQKEADEMTAYTLNRIGLVKTKDGWKTR